MFGKGYRISELNMKEANLHFDLERNAYDFLEISLELFIQARSTQNQKYWKHALLNMVFGIELLIKARLKREHALLLIENLDKYQLVTRGTKTVSWTIAIERLRLIMGEKLARLDSGRLVLAQKIRNQILHHDVLLEFPETYSVYANLMNFVTEFHKSEFAKSANETVWDKITINPYEQDKIHEDLYSLFVEEIVVYNNMLVSKELKDETIREQSRRFILVNGKDLERLAYGDESGASASERINFPCHDCLVVKGQLHLFGCDMEECPHCATQLISCECTKVYAYEDVKLQH